MTNFINKVGIFLQDVAAGLHFVKEYQPKAVLLMDASPLQVQYVRDNSPETEVVWWKHEGGRHWSTTSPENWAETIWAQIGECPPDCIYYWNEPLGHDAIGQFADFDSRQARFIRRMRQLLGGQARVGAFCFAEGNFTKDGPDLPVNFPQSVDEAEMVFIHEYWKPRLYSAGMIDYHCLRWPYWLGQFDRVGRSDLKIGITECGVTMAVGGGPDVGYLSEEAMSSGLTWQQYRDDLDEYHAQCCQEQRIEFIIPFLVSPWPGQWQSFRLDIHTELLNYIMSMKAPGEAPENGGNVEVYDFDGTKKDAAWLKNVWGTEVKPSTARSGETHFAVQTIRIGEGPCAIINDIDDAGGNPMQGVLVAFHWPGAPDPPESEEPPYTTEVYSWDWYRNFVFGPTNVEGNWAGAMGMGAMVNEGSPGPHSCWVHHYQYKSDCVTGLGWRTGTNHRAPRLEWKLVENGGTTPPPGGEYMWREVSRSFTAGASRIRLHTSGGNLFDTRGDMKCGTWQLPDAVEPNAGGVFEFDTTYTENEVRTYTAWIFKLPGNERVSDEVACEFGPSKRGAYDVYLNWSENGGEPTPPPEGIEPMEGSLLDRVQELESQVRSLGALDVTEMLNTINQIKSLLAG